MKMWGGRFKNATNQLVEEYNASIAFDHQLAAFDIQGSLAHVKMLGHCNILPQSSVDLISGGLRTIQTQQLEFKLSDEDVHMNIERFLHTLIGDEAN
ncbi:MAG: argininosuccinate lyase, partial [Pseudomonadota bacterium]|nr:argininosuccinate lyase [Pseudomonadota bacterium]